MGNRETTTIEVSQDTWRRLAALKDAPGKSFDDVIRELLEEENGGMGGMDEPESDATPMSRARERQTHVSQSHDETHHVVDEVSAAWDNDGRLEDRRQAAQAAVDLLLERGQLGKRDAVDQLLPEYAVDGQDEETWWRRNCRDVVSRLGTYSKAKQAYVLDR